MHGAPYAGVPYGGATVPMSACSNASLLAASPTEDASLPVVPDDVEPPHAPSDAALAVVAAAPNMIIARVAFAIGLAFGARLKSTCAPQNGHVSSRTCRLQLPQGTSFIRSA
jgi:hypothetical protein